MDQLRHTCFDTLVVTTLTTLEMLDVLEAGIAALRSKSAPEQGVAIPGAEPKADGEASKVEARPAPVARQTPPSHPFSRIEDL
jgi:hypothetical protein